MKKLFTLLSLTFLVALTTNINAQAILSWAKHFEGPGGDDDGKSIAVDASGNVYTTGFFQGTADFDPGAGTFTLSATGGYDIFISKLNAAGNFVWAKSMAGSAGNDVGTSITIDASGNVLTTGYFTGTVDFDPGAGVTNLISAGVEEIFVSKLDAAGNFVWAKALGGSSSDEGHGIVTDATGNVYTTGSYRGTPDFDPNGGTFNLPNGVFPTIFVSKLDATGNFVWAKAMGGTSGNDYGRSISLDASGSNVYTTGFYTGTEDFDPNAGVSNLTSAGGDDIFVSKLDAAGNFVFAKSIGGTAQDNGLSIKVDGSGNIYTTGFFYGTCDFDPSGTTYTIAALGGSSIFVSKLDPSGNFAWAHGLGNATGTNSGLSITTDAAGNVYTSGVYEMMMDFDPGTGFFNLNANGFGDIFILKLTGAGNFVWAKGMGGGGPGADRGRGIATDALGNVYTTGSFNLSCDFDPNAGTFVLTIPAFNIGDVFVHKMCELPATPSALFGPTVVCYGSTNTYSIAPVPGATSYNWSLPSGWIGTSTTNVISTTANGGSAPVKITAMNACGNSTLDLMVNITVLNGNVNAGPNYTLSCNQAQLINAVSSPTNPTSVSWSPTVGLSSSTVLTPSVVPQNSPTQYIVTVTLSTGCVVKDTVVVTPFVITPSICIVTADSANINNEVFWDKAAYPALDSMIIFREVTNNVYKQIGAISKKALSYFIDTTRSVGPANGNPNISTYRYKIQVRDSCGRYGPKSLWHNTIYFTHSGSTFQWNNYMIEGGTNPVQTYSLMVCPNYTVSTTYTLVGTCAGTQAQLNDPNYNVYQANADWRVIADLGYQCIPTMYQVSKGLIEIQGAGAKNSRSNIQNNRPVIGVKENEIAKSGIKVYPNPTKGEVTINLTKVTDNTVIEIYNTIGQLVWKEKASSLIVTANLSKVATGIYQLRVLENGRVVKHEKIVKE